MLRASAALAVAATAAVNLLPQKAPASGLQPAPEFEPFTTSQNATPIAASTSNTGFTVDDACASVNGERVAGVVGIAMNMFNKQGDSRGDFAVLCFVEGADQIAQIRGEDPFPDPNTIATPYAWTAVVSSDSAGITYIQTVDGDFTAPPNSSDTLVRAVPGGGTVSISQPLDLTGLQTAPSGTRVHLFGGVRTDDGQFQTVCGVETTVDELGGIVARPDPGRCDPSVPVGSGLTGMIPPGIDLL